MRQYSLPTVFSEIGVPSGPLQEVAKSAGASVASLNPLELTPPPGAAPLSYFAVMEYDLTALEGPARLRHEWELVLDGVAPAWW